MKPALCNENQCTPLGHVNGSNVHPIGYLWIQLLVPARFFSQLSGNQYDTWRIKGDWDLRFKDPGANRATCNVQLSMQRIKDRVKWHNPESFSELQHNPKRCTPRVARTAFDQKQRTKSHSISAVTFYATGVGQSSILRRVNILEREW